MKTFTVKQLAQRAGVSIRALHHYDQIGLLHPAYVSDNGYRYYTRDELLKLQEILFFKQMGFTLQQIEKALEKDNSARAELFLQHRVNIEKESRRQLQLLKTIDRTIADLKGESRMKTADLYKGFSAEKQVEHEEFLKANLGPEAAKSIEQSKAKLEADANGNKDALIQSRMEELQLIEGEIVLAMQGGINANDEALDAPIHQHHAWVAQWWGKSPEKQAYVGLAQMYKSHLDFSNRYEAIAPGLTDFLVEAMTSFANRNL